VPTATVLVVDDDFTLLTSGSRMLKRESYEVFSAERPTHAEELVATVSPVHLVILDIIMPEMYGAHN
jgi:response regulator RpfG family c-di-GMP phosphodiesterase